MLFCWPCLRKIAARLQDACLTSNFDRQRECATGSEHCATAAGVDAGSRLRVRGEGNVGRKGGEPGDLYVFISVKAHPAGLRREGTTIHSEVEISFVDAILGTTAKVSPMQTSSAFWRFSAATWPRLL